MQDDTSSVTAVIKISTQMHLKWKIKNLGVKNAAEYIIKDAQAEDFLKQTGKKSHGFANTVFLEPRQLMEQAFKLKITC